MLKRIILPLILVLSWFIGSAQTDETKVTWKAHLEPQNPKIGQAAFIIFNAKIEKSWHIYGTDFEDCGPIHTSILDKKITGAEITGKFTAVNPHVFEDELFGCTVHDLEGNAQFKLPIKVTGKEISGFAFIESQSCQTNGVCLPPFESEVKFSGTAGEASEVIPNVNIAKDDEKERNNKQPENEEDLLSGTSKVGKNTEEAVSDGIILELENPVKQTGIEIVTNVNSNSDDCDIPRKAGWDDIEIVHYEGGEKQSTGFLEILLLVLATFAAGLVTVFTPCVFPMLPMTVTFFTKSNKTRGGAISQALIYGFSIIAIYTLIGVFAGKLFGEEFANALSTHWLPNLIFFIIFIVFALSFLGMFEITLPSGLVNKVDSKADRGGLIGTFFMAFALVLVSFSCTGPIVGSIIILSAQGEWLVPTATMFGFALGFALPFTILALFPSLMEKLPQSGGWLNAIKVTLGLAELALALKFLSQIDQVENLGILDRETFLAIWIGVFLTIALYLFGKIRFPHDSPIEKIGVFRGLLAIGSLCFAIYLTPGLWGAPLNSLAGLLPPMSTQDFILGQEKDDGEYLCEDPIYKNDLHIAHEIKGYFDFRQAICCAKEQKKPLFIDFTGKGCANCRLMEQKVWSDKAVLDQLKNDFVVVSLYADYNKIKLPESEHYMSKEGRKITTLGKSIADLEKTKFGTVSLPRYAIVGYDEVNSINNKIVLKELAPARSYDPDIEGYLDFLSDSKKNYENLNK